MYIHININININTYSITPFFIHALFFSAAQWLQQLCEAPSRAFVAVRQRKEVAVHHAS